VQAQGVRDADELGAGWQRPAGEDAALAVRGGLKLDMLVDATTASDKPLYELGMRHRYQFLRVLNCPMSALRLRLNMHDRPSEITQVALRQSTDVQLYVRARDHRHYVRCGGPEGPACV